MVKKPLSRLKWWLLSVPIYFKILGIVALVAILFAAIILYHVRGSMTRNLYQMLEQRTLSIAISLSSSLERPMITNDLFTINQELHRTLKDFPDIRYILVQDQNGRIIAHTFAKVVPPDLSAAAPQEIPPRGMLQVLASAEGLLFDATMPVLDGRAGSLRVGVTDKMIAQELSAITRSVLWVLALCMVIGQGLALFLTYIFIRPIHQLVSVTDRIRRGDFECKAEVLSADEVGKLAEAFNQMAEGLRKYRREVQEKEAARISLIERIVLAQEEERKKISRELHDQLGQSLLAIFLTIQSKSKDSAFSENLGRDLESKIRELIDEVHRLAYGMRPAILDDYGLDFALARYTKESAERFKIPIDYQYICPSDGERLPGRIEITLYRIAQEAVTNIIRHAQAHRASVILLWHHHEVTLLVEDDGVGFDSASVQKGHNTCLGLIGMKERAALLGGDFSVESVPGNGASIRVRIPLKEGK